MSLRRRRLGFSLALPALRVAALTLLAASQLLIFARLTPMNPLVLPVWPVLIARHVLMALLPAWLTPMNRLALLVWTALIARVMLTSMACLALKVQPTLLVRLVLVTGLTLMVSSDSMLTVRPEYQLTGGSALRRSVAPRFFCPAQGAALVESGPG